MHRGHLSALAPDLTQSGNRRLFRGGNCAETVAETRDTVVFALRTPAEKGRLARKMLRVTVVLVALGGVLGVPEDTGLAWLGSAAKTAHASHTHWLRALPVTAVQRDEMGSVSRGQHAQQAGPAGDSPAWSEDGRQ
jgi:hypothetical protein